MKKSYNTYKWGNSISIPVPSYIWEKLKEQGWSQDDKVTYDIQNGKIVVEREVE